MQSNKRAGRYPQDLPAASPRKSSPAPWRPGMTSKEFTRYIFASLDVIVADKELPSAAFGVAYVIAQHLNKETNEAFPGTDVIAEEAGLAQSTVRAMVDKLAERGHYAVEFGSRGSGHSNKYRLTALEPTAAKMKPRKQRTAAVSDLRKERTVAVLDDMAKERFQGIKQRTVAMNHYNHQEPGLRPGGLVDRVKRNQLTETSDDARLSPVKGTGEVPLSAAVAAENPDADKKQPNAQLGTPANAHNGAGADVASVKDAARDTAREPMSSSLVRYLPHPASAQRPVVKTHHAPRLSDCAAVAEESRADIGTENFNHGRINMSHKPNVAPAEALKPWLDLGMSRATWYRKRRETPPSGETPASVDHEALFARPTFTPAEEEGLQKLRAILPKDNGPEGTRTLYASALNHGATIPKLLAAADVFASGSGVKALAELLFYWEDWWTIAAIRTEQPL
jgi:helix-turn-helix protein